MAEQPKWADKLIEKVKGWCEEQGREWKAPSFEWGKWQQVNSRGSYYHSNRIFIRLGKYRTDAKLVLLHEIAHSLTPGQHHNLDFWDMAWALYRMADLPIKYCQRREYPYMAKAKVSYCRSRKGK